ncbi:hypothetical protein chiPu_0006854 [Chiloscyllium punctatum]|uniref:Uncharacterized protein n=1 Tax=Chiloscyllium punctatum TaxID=137246 RepID=A0A401SDJ3_CHIPU|nr:hypothetical protein [Chiloscyllium punctatum]
MRREPGHDSLRAESGDWRLWLRLRERLICSAQLSSAETVLRAGSAARAGKGGDSLRCCLQTRETPPPTPGRCCTAPPLPGTERSRLVGGGNQH